MLELIKENYADIFFDESHFCLQVVWKAEMNDEDYKRVFNYCIDYASNYRVDNFVSDIRNQRIISPETRKWFETDALPRAVKTGLKRGGIVFTGNVFKKYYANNILLKSKNLALPLKFFSSLNEANNWFESYDK